jgi:hypothetical protein
MTRAASEQDHDDGLGPWRLLLSAQTKKVAKHQSAETETSEPQKTSSGNVPG